MFVHHVFFWLKQDLTEAQIQQFEEGVKSLLTIEGLKFGDVGTPVSSERPVVDSSYAYSLLTVFENAAAHDHYQPHPTHKKFLETCSPMFERVVVYDSETI